jgi:type VI secretion system secreted protein VgrG
MPKPRIYGLQQAIVTAEEYPDGAQPEINANELGAVRVRFPWDTRPVAPGVPSSRWVSVSQYWAGVRYGSLHTPRVGQFVLVAFQDGDPERPVVVGRLYSEQMPPPYDPSVEPTRTTWKSQSSPKAEGSNELRFEDKARAEEVYLHAQRDLNEVVNASHSTSVGGDQSNSVGGNQSNSVAGNRTHSVTGNEQATVTGNRTHSVTGTETVSITGNRTSTYSSDESITVGGFRTVNVGSDLKTSSTNTYFYPAGDFQVDSTTAGFNQSASFYVKAGGCELSMSAGIVSISNGAGSSIALIGGIIMITAGAALMNQSGGPVNVLAGGPIGLVAGGNISGAAPLIQWNG